MLFLIGTGGVLSILYQHLGPLDWRSPFDLRHTFFYGTEFFYQFFWLPHLLDLIGITTMTPANGFTGAYRLNNLGVFLLYLSPFVTVSAYYIIADYLLKRQLTQMFQFNAIRIVFLLYTLLLILLLPTTVALLLGILLS